MSKPVILLDQGEFVGLSGATSGDVLTWNGTAWVSSPNGTGTVTSVTAGDGLLGGTITTNGTISLPGVGVNQLVGSTSSATFFEVDAYGRVIDLGYSNFALAASAITTGTLAANRGGTGLGAPPALDVGKVLTAKADGTYELATPAAGAVTDVTASAPLASSGGATPDISLTGTVSPANGGTGLGAPAAGDVGKLLTATALGTYELATLPNVGTAGTYGSASSVPVFSTDAQGRVSAVTDTSIGISTAQVTGLDTALGTFALKTTTISAGTGLSGGGSLAANRTISMPSVGSAGTYGSASSVAVVTTDAQGRVSGATTTAIAIAQSAVADLVTDLSNKADKSVTATAGAGLTGGGSLAANFSFALDTAGTAASNQGSASKTVTISTDAYGRVTALSEQAIGSLPATAISSGQLALAQGGTGIDASGVTGGQLLVGGSGVLALQSVSGDATLASTGAVAVTRLQGNAVSATVLGVPDAGKALVWSGSEWQATNIQGGGGGGGLTFYMNYAASSPYPMSTQFDENAGWDTGAITVANDANGTALGTFVTAVGSPAIEVIPAGLWDVNFYAQSSDGVNSTAVRVKVATLAGATQTVLATSDWVYLSDPSAVVGYSASVYVPLTDVALTDRVEIIFEGRRFVSPSQTITVHFGNDSITHAHTTINAPGGTGLLKVVDGYLQSPASLLVNADVDSAAAIAVSKLASGTNSYVLTTVAGVPTWSPPVATGVTSVAGVGNQVLVNGNSGSPQTGALVLSLPQPIATTSTPTFGALTLSTLADGVLKATGGTGFVQSGFVNLATSEVGGTLPINKGGTNLTSSGASGNLLVSNGSSWASVAMAGDATIASTGTITLANAGSAGTYGSASAVPVFVTDAKGRVTSVTNTSIAIGAGAITSGTLSTTRGGTGVSNPSTGTLLLGAGASAMTSLSGVAGDVVRWSGSTWAASALASNAVTSLTAGTGVSVSASTGAVTVSIGQSVATSASPSFAGLTLTGLTGYLKGNGASVVSASSTIPVADVTGAAPLASPTFTGTPLSTTAAVDNDTTQIATTAYVVGQGYLKSATASSIYAPLASPTFTGTVTLPLTTAGYVKTTSAGVISSSATVSTGDLSGQVSLANGGTNASLTATAGGAVYGTGAALAVTAAGTSGQFLQSNGALPPDWASVTASAPYDLRGMFVGNPASSAIIDRFVADRTATISTTSTNHKFSAGSLPSAGVVVLTVQRTRTVLGVPATVVVFTATSASTDTILNGYYPMTISAVTNGDVIENDVLEVVVQVGAVNASFATIVYTISAVA